MKKGFKKRMIACCLALSMLLTDCILTEAVFAAQRNEKSEETYNQRDNEYREDNYSKKITEKKPVEDDHPMFDYIDKDAFKEQKHVERLESEEELDTYVFQNEDGTKTIYYMDENVKFKDEYGEIRDKDITLVEESEGYSIVQNEVELFLPENPTSGVEVEYLGCSIKMIPQGDGSETVIRQEDNSIVYENFFDENSSLKYTPLLSGVKEDIILSAYAENVAYDFLVETEGLYIYNDGDGYYLADKNKTDAVFYLGDVIVYDAVGKPTEGTMEVQTVEEGQRYLLTLSVDDEFLSDPTTEYPVTIDPSITISDTDTDTGSIIDAPIFSGYPSKNYANYIYNRVGTPSSAYGVGRTVVKLPGLYNSTEYTTISADQIESVKFYVKEASGGAANLIYLYPLTSNKTWTETSVTWNNVGSYTTALSSSASLSYGKVAAFDITNLVKAWKNGTYSAGAGFIMMNKDETRNKCFCSSEYSTSSSRPYVVMTYTTDISLNKSVIDIDEGSTYSLVATTNPTGLAVTYSTSNSSVATVSSSGVVTGKKAGTAVITAKMVDSDGVIHTTTCTVYVCVADGVYYIQNMNSGYYLNVYAGRINNLTDVQQYSKYSSTISTQYKLRQMWKLCYLGNGRYSVRPMNKLNMGLDVTGGNVDIFKIGTVDTLAAIAYYGEWVIEWNSSGYIFKNNGNSALTMQIEDESTTINASVIATTYSATANCRWTLSKISSPPSGVFIYNTSSQSIISSNYTNAVAIGQSRTLSDLGMTTAVCSGNTIDQMVYWKSADSNIAKVNASTGEITGVSEGSVTIIAYKYINGTYLSDSYTLKVVPFENGTYFIKNRQYGRYLQIDNNDSNDYCTSGSIMEQWAYDGGDYQKWIFTSLDNGYYKIVSEKSGLALSVVATEVSSQDVSLIQQAYTGAYRQQWKITQTENGSYKIAPRTAESSGADLVMAVGDSIMNDSDGVNIQQRVYVANTSYKDEWYIGEKRIFNATVNCYFDMGYCVRYNETADESQANIENYLKVVADIYEELVGLQIDYHVSYYNSQLDQCKGTVSESNINQLCTHATDHSQRSNVLSEIKNAFTNSNTVTNVYLSGHRIISTGADGTQNENRSCASGNVILLIGISDEDEREYKSQRGFLHELNHQYGAPDHYHDEAISGDEKSCINKPVCSHCGSEGRLEACVMGTTKAANGEILTICEGCIEDIQEHLIDHHE